MGTSENGLKKWLIANVFNADDFISSSSIIRSTNRKENVRQYFSDLFILPYFGWHKNFFSKKCCSV